MGKSKRVLRVIKKVFKISFFIFLILFIVGGIYMNRQGKLIYGQLTKRVEYNKFKPQKGGFALTNVNILSPNGDTILQNRTIIIEESKINSIDTILDTSHKGKVIDASGKYLIPGFIDTHVHLFQSPNDLLLYLANGVTEIRELIGEEDHLKWKQQIEENERIGPKMHVSSPRIGSFETLEGWFMEYSQGYANIKTPEEAREMIQEFHDQGYDGIKIYSQVTKEVYYAVLDKANELNMQVAGHIPWSITFEDVWKSGYKNVVHFEELMNALSREFDDKRKIGSFKGKEEAFLKYVESRAPALAEDLRSNDVAITSTLWLTESFAKQPFEIEEVLKSVELEYENPGISEWVTYIPQGLGWLPNVNRYKLPENITEEQTEEYRKYWSTYAKACQMLARVCASKGVKIMTGTDANLPPTVPGFSLHDEFLSLNKAGMSTSQVLSSATAIPANYLGSNSGIIAQGLDANLVLLDKNPLENISNTKSINSVIMKGELYDRALLDDILKAVKDANDSSRKIDISNYTDLDY